MTDANTAALDGRGKNFRINGDRLWDTLMEMAKIGPGVAGGNNRQTLTDEDAEGRRLFQSWCEAEGRYIWRAGVVTPAAPPVSTTASGAPSLGEEPHTRVGACCQ